MNGLLQNYATFERYAAYLALVLLIWMLAKLFIRTKATGAAAQQKAPPA